MSLHLDGTTYELSTTEVGLKTIYVCSGINVVIQQNIMNCTLNGTYDNFHWFVNGSTILYTYNLRTDNSSGGDNASEFNITVSQGSSTKYSLNFTSMLTVTSRLQYASLQCGSDRVRSNVIAVSTNGK